MGITNENVLIGYYSASIPSSLMTYIMSMETISKTIDEWYKKTISFQTMMDCTVEICECNANLGKVTCHQFQASSTLQWDPNAIDVDAVCVPFPKKLTSEECQRCIKNNLCFKCHCSSHSSNSYHAKFYSNTASAESPSKKKRKKDVNVVAEKYNKEEISPLPDLIECDNEDEELSASVSFTTTPAQDF